MLLIHRTILGLGGVAKTSELIAAGHSPDSIRLFSTYGMITRVRKGWYANPGVPVDVIAACRVGGRLGCVSALAFHSKVTMPTPSILHVSVVANSCRLRSPRHHRERLADYPELPVLVHWNSNPLSGDRQAVSLEDAYAQTVACQGREIAHLILHAADTL